MYGLNNTFKEDQLHIAECDIRAYVKIVEYSTYWTPDVKGANKYPFKKLVKCKGAIKRGISGDSVILKSGYFFLSMHQIPLNEYNIYSKGQTAITTCIVPKGTQYYLDDDGDIACTDLIVNYPNS